MSKPTSASSPPLPITPPIVDREDADLVIAEGWQERQGVLYRPILPATPSSPETSAPDEIVFPSREMTPEDVAALRVRPEEPSAFGALLDELLDTRQRIASGECRSWDEADYLAEVENDLRFRVLALYDRQREEIEDWHRAAMASWKDYVDALAQLERLKAEQRKEEARQTAQMDEDDKDYQRAVDAELP